MDWLVFAEGQPPRTKGAALFSAVRAAGYDLAVARASVRSGGERCG